ncbi:MAG: hypothetical protein ABI597_04415 [Gammaproteobacteria bacterium]
MQFRQVKKQLLNQVKRLEDTQVKADELGSQGLNFQAFAEEINQRQKLPYKKWDRYEKEITKCQSEYNKEQAKPKPKLKLKDITKTISKWQKLVADAGIFIGLESKKQDMAGPRKFLSDQAQLISRAEQFVEENDVEPNPQPPSFSTTAKVKKATLLNKKDKTLTQPLLDSTPKARSPDNKKNNIEEVKQKLADTKASLAIAVQKEIQKTPDAFAEAEKLSARYGSQRDLAEKTSNTTQKAKKSSSGFWCCCKSENETENDIDLNSSDNMDSHKNNKRRK